MKRAKFSADSECPLEQAIAFLGGKWKPLILFHLFEGPQRFSALKRAIPMATDQMLTLHLRELERDGLITRTVFAQVPPRVDYAVTRSAQELKPVLDQLVGWAIRHRAGLGEGTGSEPCLAETR